MRNIHFKFPFSIKVGTMYKSICYLNSNAQETAFAETLKTRI